VSCSHRGRCRNDTAFAALAGASPIPASSGRTIRYRLNRGGDHQLNRALHDIVLTHWRVCPRTHAYIAKQRAQGTTTKSADSSSANGQATPGRDGLLLKRKAVSL
jgi:transposase